MTKSVHVLDMYKRTLRARKKAKMLSLENAALCKEIEELKTELVALKENNSPSVKDTLDKSQKELKEAKLRQNSLESENAQLLATKTPKAMIVGHLILMCIFVIAILYHLTTINDQDGQFVMILGSLGTICYTCFVSMFCL